MCMKRMKKVVAKLICFLLIINICIPCTGSKEVQAARISYNKAVRMYDNANEKWIDARKTVRVNYDLNEFATDRRRLRKKKVSIEKIYYGNNDYWMYRDINGDGIPEAIFGYGAGGQKGQLMILTIYKNKVKLLGTFQATNCATPDFFYNNRNKTFMISAAVSPRVQVRYVFKMQKGKMKKIMTMADSVGQMNRFGKVPVWYYINGRQSSKKTYQKYYKRYCSKTKYLRYIGW